MPLRARISERLGHSGPTVSQTVGRMERDGLVVVSDDRRLELTDSGRQKAVDVMRKHRLAERLLSDVIGLDWRIGLADGWQRVGHDRAVQGNLDPMSLFAPLPVLRERVAEVLMSAGNRPGHIFNLGHGVTPGMDPENVKALVEMVHEMGET